MEHHHTELQRLRLLSRRKHPSVITLVIVGYQFQVTIEMGSSHQVGSPECTTHCYAVALEIVGSCLRGDEVDGYSFQGSSESQAKLKVMELEGWILPGLAEGILLCKADALSSITCNRCKSCNCGLACCDVARQLSVVCQLM